MPMHIYFPFLVDVRYSTVIAPSREWYLTLFEGLLILKNINMRLLKRIIREPVFSGHPVLSGH